jgi:hypothetical protein
MAGVTKKAESALRSCLEILFSKFIVENLKSPPYPSALLLAGLCYVAQANLKFTILLPQFPECWDYWHVSPCLAKPPKFYQNAWDSTW